MDVHLVDLEQHYKDTVPSYTAEQHVPPDSVIVETGHQMDSKNTDSIKNDGHFGNAPDMKENAGGDFKGDSGKIKGGSDEDQKDAVKVIDWNEFTQNTTFHGVKYIFEDTPIKLRR